MSGEINYTPVMAGPVIEGYDPHPLCLADVVRVHDGDTVLVRVQLEVGISAEVWVRLEGYNSPELHGPHKALALEATQALKDFLAQGQVLVKLTGAITFDRRVGRVFVALDGKPVDASEHLARFNVTQGQ